MSWFFPLGNKSKHFAQNEDGNLTTDTRITGNDITEDESIPIKLAKRQTTEPYNLSVRNKNYIPSKPRIFPNTGEDTGGLVVNSHNSGRIFGRNGSKSQIWWSDDSWGSVTGFYIASEGGFNSVAALSKSKVIVDYENPNDSTQDGLYILEDTTGDGEADRFEKVLTYEVDNPSFSFGVDYYPRHGGAKIVLVGEYGKDDAGDYARHLHFSEDGGETYRIIFELPEDSPGETHLHGVHYDPYADRIWACNGDGNASNAWYCDNYRDNDPEWIRIWEKNEAPTQFTSIFSTPHRVLFGTDGAINGIWSVERETDKQKIYDVSYKLKPFFTIDPSPDTNYVGRNFQTKENGEGYYIILDDIGNVDGSVLLGSADGERWYELFRGVPGERPTYLALNGDEVVFRVGAEKVRETIIWKDF